MERKQMSHLIDIEDPPVPLVKEAKLRDCYAETIEFNSEKFVKIILMDAAFILEVLLKSSNPTLLEENDRIFNKPWLIQDVWADMLLLENQLPFFILELLFNSYKPWLIQDAWADMLLLENQLPFFSLELLFNSYKPWLIQDVWADMLLLENQLPLFILELLFNSYRTDVLLQNDGTTLTINKLIVVFFQNRMESPGIEEDGKKSCRLVETRKDLDLLVKKGIIENRLSNSREGSLLLNKLADGVILDQDNFYFATLFEELNKYYNTSWHKWKAHLKQKYFRRCVLF
ncbi:uncharacterized protein LOC132190723 [Corylus avellana]|uniref:uncharacterized protein LOC132190723 n=1 Tax=Corylus avellana TaxID=13451 RepID=UPI00286AA792|nr:uncharacterized protein LOC132190723 [Corylus avellana]